MAIAGVLSCLAIFVAVLLDAYYPVQNATPPIKVTDPNVKKKSVEELQELEPRAPKLPMVSLAKLAENNGQPGAKAWVACKGVVYDVSSNEVYKTDGGYNCFTGKDATLALAKM